MLIDRDSAVSERERSSGGWIERTLYHTSHISIGVLAPFPLEKLLPRAR